MILIILYSMIIVSFIFDARPREGVRILPKGESLALALSLALFLTRLARAYSCTPKISPNFSTFKMGVPVH